jgi:hypothetical protein
MNPIGDDELAELARGFPNLRSLDVRGLDRPVTWRGVRALAAAPALSRLHRLNLSSNGLGDEAVRALAGTPLALRLTHLDLSYNDITPDGAQGFLDPAAWPQLVRLDLESNLLDRDALLALRAVWGARFHARGVRKN